ncbi:MAG: hypothetical protein GEU68_14755 [Actinobacteria bacterium]|nr:hypothetical protein [Actinomycetota bacterium]
MRMTGFSDGLPVKVGVPMSAQWDAVDLATDNDFATNSDRLAQRGSTRAPRALLKRRSTAEWLKRLEAAGVPAGAIRSLDEVFSDADVLARSCGLISITRLGARYRERGLRGSSTGTRPSCGCHHQCSVRTRKGSSTRWQVGRRRHRDAGAPSRR